MVAQGLLELSKSSSGEKGETRFVLCAKERDNVSLSSSKSETRKEKDVCVHPCSSLKKQLQELLSDIGSHFQTPATVERAQDP